MLFRAKHCSLMPYRLAASFHAEGADTAAFSGTVRWNAMLAAVEPADTIALAGLAGAIGTLAVTEAADRARSTATGTRSMCASRAGASLACGTRRSRPWRASGRLADD